MRTAAPLFLAVAILASSCVAGGDNVIAADTTNATATTAPSVPQSTAPTDSTGTSGPNETSTSTSTTFAPRPTGVVTPDTVFRPWGTVEGLTMFRGNPTRTFFGTGPVPASAPEQLWRYPDSPMAGLSPEGEEEKWWYGTGWTGQPLVHERDDGITELIFGAYDKQIHFLDADTGEQLRPGFDMGDIIKGTVTLDPDGYPLLYAGSRDPRFRILALDGDEVREVWSLHAKAVDGMWNDDWDSNPVVVDDMLYVGGENSWWFAIKLNRGYDADGMVTVAPEVVYQMPAWTDDLFELLGRQHSVENSTAIFEQKAYFATSGGRVVGVDLTDIEDGEAEVFFDFWMGDDVDSTITVDAEGYVYVVAHADHEKTNNTAARRVREVGQLVKLDTSVPVGDPLTSISPIVWSVEIPAARGQDTGAWATPALHPDGILFVATDSGNLLAITTDNGAVVWSDDVGVNAWSSPVIADGALVIAVDCFSDQSALRAYDLSDPLNPRAMWTHALATGGCIESTPAVWNGRIYVGSRDGFMYAFGS
ncbi:MAG TPA: PQQ-binding-like beta-propeller repeat protein [Acidimicrobiia bacterium]|nr:PQQ-binding-like beta-propeller repeat protein [Acidimicrobiia bacterium]